VNSSGPLDEQKARYFFTQLCQAMLHMQDHGITHRDMKLENMMLDSHYNLKIIDYGLATTKIATNSIKGTDGYVPYEVITGGEYIGSCVDMFSLGVILFTMLTATRPFGQATPQDECYKTIANTRASLFWKIHDCSLQQKGVYLSESVKDLIIGLLQFQPSRRYSLSEVMAHNWFNDESAAEQIIHDDFTDRETAIEDEFLRLDEEGSVYDINEDIFHSTEAHRGIAAEESKSYTIREEKEYNPKLKRLTQFFSKSDLSSLFNNLGAFASNSSVSYDFLPGEYSVKMTQHKVIEKKDDAKEDTQPLVLSTKVTVSILKVKDTKIHCIRVTKDKGDHHLFMQVFKDIKEFFGGHVNAKYTK